MIVWCCCSAGRPEGLVRKTLRTLQRGGFNGSLYVVVPSEEVVAYQQALSGHPIHTILLHTERGLIKQKLFFRAQFPPDQLIIHLDDDLDAIKCLIDDNGRKRLVHVDDVNAMAHVMTLPIRESDALLCGVYPVANRDWMSNDIMRKNAFVAGPLYAIRNSPLLREPEPGLDDCEDWARMCGELAAGRPVVRINWIGISTQYFKNKGGLYGERTEERRNGVIYRIEAAYPDLVKTKMRRDGRLNLAFKSRPELWELPSVTTAPSLSGDHATASDDLPELSALPDPSGQAPL